MWLLIRDGGAQCRWLGELKMAWLIHSYKKPIKCIDYSNIKECKITYTLYTVQDFCCQMANSNYAVYIY